MGDEKRAPQNTGTGQGAEELFIDSMMESMSGGNPSDAILRQEAMGQNSFVNSTTLPTPLHRDREIFEKAGIKFLEVVEDDPMFQQVELPEGWEKKATDHSMWSELVDDKGRTRAGIFYKAASYDRRARINADRRFVCTQDWKMDGKNIAVYVVKDCGKECFRSGAYPYHEGQKYKETGRKAEKSAEAEALEFLQKNYPDWKDASAYWD